MFAYVLMKFLDPVLILCHGRSRDSTGTCERMPFPEAARKSCWT